MKTLLSFHYWRFHYSHALLAGLSLWKNMVWFVFNFFSVSLLVRTLFEPWRRLAEDYAPGFNLSNWATAFLVNIIMRVVGVILRLAMIVAGLVATGGVVLVGFVSIVIWILLPAILALLLLTGLYLIF